MKHRTDGYFRIQLNYGLLIMITVLTACTDRKADVSPLLELLSADETGIDFKNEVREGLNDNDNVLSYTNFYNGGGVAVGDINGDNLVDVYLSSNQNTGKLFLNKGNFKFEDITQGSGMDTLSGWKTGVIMVDINQDNFLDIYVCRSGREKESLRTNLLYINNGDLTFTEKSKAYGLDDSSNSLHASFFDFDNDGDLDMYLLNHAVDPVRELSKRLEEYSYNKNIGDKIYENREGRYVDITRSTGIDQSELGDGLGLGIADFNNDDFADVYVCNDFLGRDFFYHNSGNRTFTDNALESMSHISYSSMGTDIADIDNDGWQDLVVLDMRSSTNYGRKTNMASMNPDAFNLLVKVGGHYQYMRNTLQLNNGNGTFSDIAPMAGLASTDWSWAPLFVDFDNDGWRDLFVTNGIRKNTNNKDYVNYKKRKIDEERKKDKPDLRSLVTDLLDKIPEEKVVNLIYQNQGGLRFEEKNREWGVTVPSFSNGAAYADLDNDGDLDLVINNIDEYAHVYRNKATELSDNHFLKVKLKGNESNINGIGAKLEVRTKNSTQFFEHYVSRGYQSSVDYAIHVGLGADSLINRIEVTWADGRVSEVKNLSADQTITIGYSDSFLPQKPRKENKLLFTDQTTSYGINHHHIENEFNDFEREVLLPHKMSTFGPALAVGDVNADGLDDFYIGGAMGYEGAIYFQQVNSSFSKVSQEGIALDASQEDTDALFFDADSDGDLDLYVVSGGNEKPIDDAYYQDRLYINDGKGYFTKSEKLLPMVRSSGGVVRACDFDRDGDEDLFVGGRLLPGQYPRASRSFLLKNDNGKFIDVTTQYDEDLEFPGMVTDALWSDYDNNGTTDLILVGEWMPITIFSNNEGTFKRIKGDSVLDNSNGWWFSITASDINGDGKTDYLLGNLGENYKYKSKPGAPFKLYSNDFDKNGSLDIVLSYYENDELYPLRGKQCSSQQIPDLKKKFKDYNSFGRATLTDVYGDEALSEADHLVSNTFSNSILIQTGDGFELTKLPDQAQVSAVFGIICDDFDQDGIADVVLAGNLFKSEVETPRNDAGRGLFLKGTGTGEFKPVKGNLSGLDIPGDVKKLKPISLGKEEVSKKGLLVAVNNDFVKLISAN